MYVLVCARSPYICPIVHFYRVFSNIIKPKKPISKIENENYPRKVPLNREKPMYL